MYVCAYLFIFVNLIIKRTQAYHFHLLPWINCTARLHELTAIELFQRHDLDIAWRSHLLSRWVGRKKTQVVQSTTVETKGFRAPKHQIKDHVPNGCRIWGVVRTSREDALCETAGPHLEQAQMRRCLAA